MKQIESITVFTGQDVFIPCLTDYDKVIDNSLEYEDSFSLLIDFYKDEKIVRRMINVPCDITYKTEVTKPSGVNPVFDNVLKSVSGGIE